MGYKIIKYTCISLCIALISACSQDSSDRSTMPNEFELFCISIKVVTEQDLYPELPPPERFNSLDNILKKTLNPKGNAYIAWQAIASATPSDRYMLMKEAANSSGYPNWQCAAAQEHMAEISAP